jgi:hypothetical protein
MKPKTIFQINRAPAWKKAAALMFAKRKKVVYGDGWFGNCGWVPLNDSVWFRRLFVIVFSWSS